MSRYTKSTWKKSRHLGFSVLETGDELKMMPFLIISAASGMILLIVVVFRLRSSKEKRESK